MATDEKWLPSLPQGGQQQQHVDGNVVIDRRSPEDASKKIIPKDEGDYVDFSEE